MAKKKITIEEIMVLAKLSDGSIRQVMLLDTEIACVKNLLRQMQGKKIKIIENKLLLYIL